MKLIYLVLLACVGVSCTNIMGPKFESNWAELEQVDQINCKRWPLGEHDMWLEDLYVLGGESEKVLLGKVRKRDGSYSYYYTKFQGSIKLDLDAMIPLSIGQSIPVLGHLPGKDKFSVIVPKDENNFQFEIRDAKTNVVSSEVSLKASEITEAKISVDKNGIWIVSNEEKLNVSYLSNDNGKYLPRSFNVDLPLESKLFPYPDGNATVLSFSGGENRMIQSMQLKSNGQISKSVSFQLKGQSDGIESWDGFHNQSGSYLIYVSGDSVVGEGKLHITKYKENYVGGEADWEKILDLKGLHMSSPIMVTNQKDSDKYALILKWLDGESTLGVYKLGEQGFEKEQNLGVFKKGSALIDAFAFGEESVIYSIIRNKSGKNWEYSLCEVGTL